MTLAAAQTQPQSLIVRMAHQYGLEPNKFYATLEKTILPNSGKNATQEQVAAFLVVANHYNLNPFIKEIFAFPSQGGGISPIVSVDGWLTLINRQPNLDGIEYQDIFDDAGNLTAITCRIYRKDRSRPNEITEYMKECKRSTPTWSQYPARMLRHKALIQCARQAFGFAGIYDPDEAERIAESEGNGNGHIAAKTKANISNLREKLAQVTESTEDPDVTHVDAEIIEDAEPEQVETPADFVDAETPATEGPETPEPETAPTTELTYPEIKALVDERIGEMAAKDVKKVLNGRDTEKMDAKQLGILLDELVAFGG